MQREVGHSAHVRTKSTNVTACGAPPVFSQDTEPQYLIQTSKKGRFSSQLALFSVFQMMSPAYRTTSEHYKVMTLLVKALLSATLLNVFAPVFPECSAVRRLPGCTADSHYSGGFRGNAQPLSTLLQHADGLQHW